MTDRPKRPTLKNALLEETAYYKGSQEFMDYQTELLRRADRLLEKLHPFLPETACPTCQLITGIREAIGEDT